MPQQEKSQHGAQDKRSADHHRSTKKGILHPKLGRRNNPQAEERILELLGYWRRTGRPVIHVQHLSRSEDSVFWPQQSGVEFQERFSTIDG